MLLHLRAFHQISNLRFSLLDETIESLEEKAKEVIEGEPILDNETQIDAPKSVTFTEYDDPLSFLAGSSGSPNIRNMSPNAWVSCGGDVHVLECPNKGFVRIDPVRVLVDGGQ